ncbi:hypothetical protein HZA57_06480, partial [Candidatus Poribacteria bacterium]|nr:hypothetical protein [Candidatus Poribacteria bacterium]
MTPIPRGAPFLVPFWLFMAGALALLAFVAFGSPLVGPSRLSLEGLLDG